jgi:exopolyphosphatase / guanosine-5'-triphosphate,3'-diphosphate pyrophosphatase
MRVGAIDIGTNTVLLLVAETGEDGELRAVEDHATITRLGQDVDKTRTLHPDAIARTTACLDAYAGVVRRLGVTRLDVVGTSAMRDAKGGELVRAHVKRVLGVEARVISGDEEARVSFAGATSGLGYGAAGGELCVFDIGGGSTEVILGAAPSTVRWAKSFDVGSVRLTERHVRADPPTAEELARVTADLDRTFTDIPPFAGVPVGVAGTMTTLAAVALELETYDGARVHGLEMPTTELRRVVHSLAAKTVADRRKVTGLEPKRADVIVAGGLVALALLERWSVKAVRISDRGVRWGIAQELAARA